MIGIMLVSDMMPRAMTMASEWDNDTPAVIEALVGDLDIHGQEHEQLPSVDFVQQLLQQVQLVAGQTDTSSSSLEITGIVSDTDVEDISAVDTLMGLGVHIPVAEGSDLSHKLMQVSVVASERVVPNITDRKLAVSVGQPPINKAYKASSDLSSQRLTAEQVTFTGLNEGSEELATTGFMTDIMKDSSKEMVVGTKDNLTAARQVSSARREAVVVVNDRRTAESSTPAELGLSEASFEESLLEVKEPTVRGVRQALTESGNGEIVRRAQIILNGQDSGEIRLTLRPEHLGTVRIHLNMEDGRVLGRIMVADTMVKAAFDDNMSDLRDSFLKNGLQGELDVSVGDNRNGGASGDQRGWAKGSGFVSERVRSVENSEEQGIAEVLGASDLYLQA